LPSKSNSHDLPSAKDEPAFSEVVRLIAASRERAIRDLNTVLIDLYWKVGEIISRQIEAAVGRRQPPCHSLTTNHRNI
jgi:hypothetical protein